MAIEKIKISELTPTNTKGLVIVTVYEGGVPKTYSYDLNNITGVVKGCEFAGFVPCSSYIGAYIKPFTSQGGIFDTTDQFFYILIGAGIAGFWDDNDQPQTFTQLNTQTAIVYWTGSQYNSVVIADNSITTLTETFTPQFVAAGFSAMGAEQKYKFDMSRYPICVRTWQEFLDTMQNGSEYINIYVCNDITADATNPTQIDIHEDTKAISISGCEIKEIDNLVLSSIGRTENLRIDVNNRLRLKSTFNPMTLVGDKGSITFNIDKPTTMNVNGEVSSSFVALTNNQTTAVKIVGNIVELYSGGVPTDITGNITISGAFTEKADKVTGATNGHLAGLDASGNLTDSGIASSNVMQKVGGATNGNVATLNASGEVIDSGKALSELANDADVVHKTGTETISGVKTFADGLITGSLFFGSQITAISISGSATWNLSDLKTMMKIVLNNASNTITLPQGGNNPFRFQIIVTQDSTGGRDLSFSVADSGTIYNPSGFDFTSGEGDQLCICTMIWTGNEYIYECTPYVGA